MSYFLISVSKLNKRILLNRFINFGNTFPNCSSKTQPDNDDPYTNIDEKKDDKVDKIQFYPTNDNQEHVTVPIIESNEHIFPKFERLITKNSTINTLMNVIQPGSQSIGLFVRKDKHNYCPDLSHLYNIGTLVSYDTAPIHTDLTLNVLLTAHHRLKQIEIIPTSSSGLNYAICEILRDPPPVENDTIRAVCKQIINFVRKLQNYFPYNSASQELQNQILDPVYWSYCSCEFSFPMTTDMLQNVLDENDLLTRLKLTQDILAKEFAFFSLASTTFQKIRDDEIRDNYLHHMNRLKDIIDRNINQFSFINSKSGGDTMARTNHVKFGNGFENKIKERLKLITMPKEIQEVFDEEFNRLLSTERMSGDYNILQNYIDNLTLIPFGIYRSTPTTLEDARVVLDKDHFGLEDVKDLTLEHLAVVSRVDRAKGRILCFVGPPGVGKTSIAKSIATATKRAYIRVSVGGIDDTADIKGHRRTYMAAFPGKIIRAIQQAKCMDPVICIDEVDKLVRSYRGDPSGTLLEAFDPEQNSGFTDNYIEVPVDLSRVLFICTANTTATIPAPLLDRMEIVRLSGYTCEEKVEITKKYLVPTMIKEFNIADLYGSNIKIDDDVIERLANEYFLEPGVRKLKNCVERICRKALKKKLEMSVADQVHITLANITDYAGYPDMRIKTPRDHGTVGLVTGLSAVEGYSVGFTMDVECDISKNASKKGTISITGLAGKSLSESSNIAVMVAKNTLRVLNPDNNYLDENDIRIHFLEGGVEKDGPSAGTAIFCSVLSQALNIPVDRNLAMTGEISLKGKIMEVGKIKEKLSAALRTGISRVIIPLENDSQYKQLNESIKSKLNVEFVDNISDLVKLVFPTLYPPLEDTLTPKIMQSKMEQ